MISDPEIRRIARRAGVEPRIVELDYALGWALRGIAGHQSLSTRLIFKGGTCLRKCYFDDYRFSEDLDFTATEWLGWDEFEKALRDAFTQASQLSGIDFAAGDPRLDIIDDEYGRETLRLTLYWRGPHARRGSPPGLRLDITRNEVLLFEPVQRRVTHRFSDERELGALKVACYALEEVVAEKIRAVSGQRIHAVSRDVYDIFSLLEHIDERKVLDSLPRKFTSRDVDVTNLDSTRLTSRKEEFRSDWERNLVHLLPPGMERTFDEVWDEVITRVTLITKVLDRNRDSVP